MRRWLEGEKARGGMAKRKQRAARAVVIHSIAHARAAMEAASALEVPVILMSAPGAASYAGARWFLSVVARARDEYPDVPVTAVLDCGDEPGRALGALREGCEAIRFTGPARVATKVGAIANQCGATLYRERGPGPALDLGGEPDPRSNCRKWLGDTSQTPRTGRLAKPERGKT
jgi:hypothetical protein